MSSMRQSLSECRRCSSYTPTDGSGRDGTLCLLVSYVKMVSKPQTLSYAIVRLRVEAGLERVNCEGVTHLHYQTVCNIFSKSWKKKLYSQSLTGCRSETVFVAKSLLDHPRVGSCRVY